MSFVIKKILVTGGAGYIGSHTVVKLLEAGHEVVVLDNLSNSKEEVINRIQNITKKKFTFIIGDVRDGSLLKDIFKNKNIDNVIHFAGLKAVGESVEKPLDYYDNNVNGSITLLDEMIKANIKNFVFSSSATVYGDVESVPITEDFPLKPTNPYGVTKLIVENILKDLVRSKSDINATILRYFNPLGAHMSGLIGEDPNGTPNNLVPYLTQVAIGKREKLTIFGNDYLTKDGTGVRDYIHVEDLAIGHLYAVSKLTNKNNIEIFNLGTGQGHSVFEIIRKFEEISNRKIPYIVSGRRSGDIAECYANVSRAKELLGWSTQFGIERMLRDTWRWQTMNPHGYLSKRN